MLGPLCSLTPIDVMNRVATERKRPSSHQSLASNQDDGEARATQNEKRQDEDEMDNIRQAVAQALAETEQEVEMEDA